MKSKIITLLIISFALVTGAKSQSVHIQLENLIQKELEHQSPCGSVLISKNNKIIYTENYGSASLEIGNMSNPNLAYNIESLNKQFTAIAILQLVENGNIKLEETISNYIPSYYSSDNHITIEDLLTHTSGIDDNSRPEPSKTYYAQNTSVKHTMTRNIELNKPYNPNHSDYALLRLIIENVTKTPYKEYVTSNLLSPAGLTNTFFDHTADSPKNNVTGHRKGIDSYEITTAVSNVQNSSLSIFFTVNDLFIWNQALNSGKILQSKSLKAAYTPHILESELAIPFGYGWETGNVQGIKVVKHYERVAGFTTCFVYVPSKDLYVVILTNCDDSKDLSITASKLAAVVMGTPFKMSNAEYSRRHYKKLNGVYKNASGEIKIIRREDNKLFIFSKGKTKSRLIAYSKTGFYFKDELTTFTIKSNSRKEPLTLIENNTNVIQEWVQIDAEISSIKTINRSSKQLEKYEGHYQIAPNKFISITAHDDQLIGRIGKETKDLSPIKNHGFITRDIDAKITFILDKKQNVIGLSLDQGRVFEASKVIINI